MPKPCDVCQSSNAVIYCRADAAYFCTSCDFKVHGANRLASRHERVWMCEVCEMAPAVVTCKADAAALCGSCDTEIHSANPLARRHERVPVTPFYECPESAKCAHIHSSASIVAESLEREREELLGREDEETTAAEAASWLLAKPSAGLKGCEDMDRGGVIEVADLGPVKEERKGILKHKLEPSLTDVDPYVNLELDYSSIMASAGTDSLVPVVSPRGDDDGSPSLSAHSFDSQVPTKKAFDYRHTSLSSSSLDVGVVPDSSLSEVSNMNSSSDASMFEFPPRLLHIGATQPMAREARVLRYKEKRKNRKFEKTIRYASRKAYAESRPRVKGRFAKRGSTAVVPEAESYGGEQMYVYVPDTPFGVVPSF